jgi:hypothetical protein
VLNTQVDVQSEVLTEYVSTRVTEAAEVGSIHISSASASALRCQLTVFLIWDLSVPIPSLMLHRHYTCAVKSQLDSPVSLPQTRTLQGFAARFEDNYKPWW